MNRIGVSHDRSFQEGLIGTVKARDSGSLPSQLKKAERNGDAHTRVFCLFVFLTGLARQVFVEVPLNDHDTLENELKALTGCGQTTAGGPHAVRLVSFFFFFLIRPAKFEEIIIVSKS